MIIDFIYVYFPFHSIPIVSFHNFCLNSVKSFYHICLPYNFVLYVLFQPGISTTTKLFANTKYEVFSSCKDSRHHRKEMLRQFLWNNQGKSSSHPLKSFHKQMRHSSSLCEHANKFLLEILLLWLVAVAKAFLLNRFFGDDSY